MRISELFHRHWQRVRADPREVTGFFRPAARVLLGLKLRGVSDEFVETGTPGLKRRSYRSYEACLAQQKSKLPMMLSGDSFAADGTDLASYDRTFREVLRARLGELGCDVAGRNVLCVAARLGTEVKAFLDHGAFAVGVDLNPGDGNAYVLPGDFHKMVFAEKSVDFIYSNSLDHAYRLDRLAAELHRVLKPGGILMAEIQAGSSEGARPNTGVWESYEWNATRDIVAVLETAGFVRRRELPILRPWQGVCCLLEKAVADHSGAAVC